MPDADRDFHDAEFERGTWAETGRVWALFGYFLKFLKSKVSKMNFDS